MVEEQSRFRDPRTEERNYPGREPALPGLLESIQQRGTSRWCCWGSHESRAGSAVLQIRNILQLGRQGTQIRRVVSSDSWFQGASHSPVSCQSPTSS